MSDNSEIQFVQIGGSSTPSRLPQTFGHGYAGFSGLAGFSGQGGGSIAGGGSGLAGGSSVLDGVPTIDALQQKISDTIAGMSGGQSGHADYGDQNINAGVAALSNSLTKGTTDGLAHMAVAVPSVGLSISLVFLVPKLVGMVARRRLKRFEEG